MVSKGISEQGKKTLGKWVAATRLSPRIREQVVNWLKVSAPTEYVSEQVTQGQFARWITSQTGFQISHSAIGRLERGETRGAPPVEVLVAITQRMEILQFPDGHFCSLDEAIAVLTGTLNPFTGECSCHEKDVGSDV